MHRALAVDLVADGGRVKEEAMRKNLEKPDWNRRDCLKWLGGTLVAAMLPGHSAARDSSHPKKRRLGTGLVADPIYKQHETGRWHPESPKRYDAIVDGLTQAGMAKEQVALKARPAADAEILACHEAEYLGVILGKRAQGTGAEHGVDNAAGFL